MKQLQPLLEQPLTSEQQELLAQYPQKALDTAVRKLRGRGDRKPFNYFLAIVKGETPDGSIRAVPVPAQSYTRDLPEEDPMEAVTLICENLTCTTETERGYILTPEMKRKAAEKDPWFDKLTTKQKVSLLTKYPFYARIVGLKHQEPYWYQLHDAQIQQNVDGAATP